jgi:hypothetical protein
MAITVSEMWTSRDTTLAEQSSIDFMYVIIGTESDLEAMQAMLAYATQLYGSFPITNRHVEYLVPGAWKGSITYGNLAPPEAGDIYTEFDTTGGTQRITQSFETTSYAPPGKRAPDFQGAIGVTKDSVEGVDVVIPALSFSKRVIMDPADVTNAYVVSLSLLTGKTNEETFLEFGPGQVLYKGAKGSLRRKDQFEITHSFSCDADLDGQTIGEITGISKPAHDYLWVRYKETDDEDAKCVVKVPQSVYVERIIRRGSFDILGIEG